MADWQGWTGRTQSTQDQLTPAKLAQFRATIDSDEVGDIAPQAIHWCLCLPETATADLDSDGHPRRDASPDSFLPPIPQPRRMWAASDVIFCAPIAVGARAERHSVIASITRKQGKSGTLVFVEISHDTHADGALVVQERQTIVYRDPPASAPMARAASATDGPDLSEWHWYRCVTPHETMLFRYSALTFNSHRIHYDAPYARAVEGYPGLVVHGPLSATLLIDLAGRNLGPNRLHRFAMRAVSPAFTGETLHLVGKTAGDNITLAALGPDGRTIVSAIASI